MVIPVGGHQIWIGMEGVHVVVHDLMRLIGLVAASVGVNYGQTIGRKSRIRKTMISSQDRRQKDLLMAPHGWLTGNRRRMVSDLGTMVHRTAALRETGERDLGKFRKSFLFVDHWFSTTHNKTQVPL